MAKQNPQGDKVASSPIFKKFLGTAEDYLKRPTRVKQLLNDAYTKASEKKDIGSIAHEAWETMQTMFRLIRTSVSGEYTGLPTTTVVAAVAVTLYFLSPIDLIPDFIPVLGLLDDVALVAWFSTTIKEELDKFAEWEKTRPSVVEDEDYGTFNNRYTTTSPTTSDTDSGLGSPTSSQPGPSSISSPAPATEAKPHADVAANTSDSSRSGSDTGFSGGDTGGNVR